MPREHFDIPVELRQLSCSLAPPPDAASEDEQFLDDHGLVVPDDQVVALALRIQEQTGKQIVSRRSND
jgi:hypothetical protein